MNKYNDLISKVYELYNKHSDQGVQYDFDYESRLNEAIGRLTLDERSAVGFLKCYLESNSNDYDLDNEINKLMKNIDNNLKENK